MSRVIVGVAQATGRPVKDVLGESFALALWTWHWLDDLSRERQMRERFARLDAASLTALAFHDPSKLQQVEMQLLADAGELADMMAQTRAQIEARVARIAQVTGANDGAD